MWTILFAIFGILIFGDLLWLCIKLAWSVWKIVLTLVCLPLLLIWMVICGLMYIAVPVLVVIGIIALIASFIK